MAFNTYGYNGVLDLRKEVVDRLVAQVHERNMVEVDGVVSNDEFITLDMGVRDGLRIVAYLKITKAPTCTFDPSAKAENTLDLAIPLQVAIWVGAIGETGTTWMSLANGPADAIVKGLHLVRTSVDGKTVLRPDFDTLGADQIVLVQSLLALDDASASELRERILDALRSGAVKDIDIEVPDAGSVMKPLASWDLHLVSKLKPGSGATYDGLDLLLYESAQSGQGVVTDAGNTIPQGSAPPYDFALTIKAGFVEQFMQNMLDRLRGYFRQGDTLNTATNPFGYMVVSSSGHTNTYHVPAPLGGGGAPHKVTLGAPVDGQVTLVAPGGTFAPNSRCHLRNIDLGLRREFSADGAGAATVAVLGQAGQQIAIEVDAVSLPKHPDLLIWRPTVGLRDGFVHLDFHYRKDVAPCVAPEGDGWADLALTVDRTSTFKLTSSVVDYDFDLPWWTHVLGFLSDVLTGGLAAGLTGGIVNGLVASILVETIAIPEIKEYVGGMLTSEMQQGLQLPIPGAGRLALFLERVDVQQVGIVLSGYAEAGNITHYGRKRVQVGAAAGTVMGVDAGAFGLHLDAKPGDATAQVYALPPLAAMGSSSAAGFWSADYADGAAVTCSQHSLEVAAGGVLALWVHSDRTLTKVLVEWDPIRTPWFSSNAAYLTWVSYAEWVAPSVAIDNHLTATTAVLDKKDILFVAGTSYGGYLRADVRKYFRTPVTLEAGLETWTWNGQPVPPGGSVAEAGVAVTWDTKTDRLLVNIAQTELVPFPLGKRPSGTPTGTVPEHHEVRYECTDVFGQHASASLSLDLPVWSVTVKKPKYKVLLRHDSLPDPPFALVAEEREVWEDGPSGVETGPTRDDVERRLFDLLSERAGTYPYVRAAARQLARAVVDGRAAVDRDTVSVVLDLLHAPGPEQAPGPHPVGTHEP